jgi:TRAP-type transport system periplasmic protein
LKSRLVKVVGMMLAMLLAFGTVLSAAPANAGEQGKKKEKEKDKAKTVLTVATPFKDGHILTEAAERFKVLVETRSKDKIRVDIQAGIDSEEDVNLKTAKGEIDIQITGGEPLEVYSPQYFFFNAPYVIKDYDHFLRVWNGELGDEAKALIKKNGNMISLSTAFRGMRQTTSNKPITGPADIQGLKLRLPVVPDWIAIWEEVGAKPVPVPLPELYQSLKDGRAEASEGDLPQIDSFKLSEVQSHLTITNHLVAVGWATINADTYKKLKKKDRKLVEKAMKEATDWATAKTISDESNLIEKLKGLGMTVGTPDADAIREKAKPAVEKLFQTQWPVTTWAEVLAQ